MPKIINPAIKRTLKKALLDGKSARKACLEAGLSKTTAHCATQHKVVKECLSEIMNDFKLSDITPENVVKKLEMVFELALAKRDYNTAKGCVELMGKYLAIWKDKSEIEAIIKRDENRLSNLLSTINTSPTRSSANEMQAV